ncbi:MULTISPECIES: amidohydrolase family protein [Actinomadura]|uniref:amidohydrolase family protein n=1 Tax=Actinomadura TaxID=1988 RepID=UPI0003AD17B0|nr:amidohydrolase family protein [Actinomadura madurae]SPT64033.1 Predicted metal-dependent hydrolase of the TIM-barrel fold [Actinomadura madurae]
MTEATGAEAARVFTPSPGNPGPHPRPRRPSLALPSGSTDAHCHVFGPADVFPYPPDRAFTPVDAPRDEVTGLQRFLGFQRAVFVQSAGHGTDHRPLLDALAADRANRRGVAILRPGIGTAEILRLDAAGVCGARLHFVTHLGPGPEPEQALRMLGQVADLGWHAEIHVRARGIVEHAALIAAIPAPVVIDHMARVDLAEGLDGPSVQALTSLLERGDVWVKLSGVDRLSLVGPPYPDAVALAALLVERFPERVVWGTDYPHVNITGTAPDDGMLVDLIEQMAPTAALRERLLVTNPAELFGFGPATEPASKGFAHG